MTTASGVMVQPGMFGDGHLACRTAFETLPELLVEVEAHRVAQRFDGGDQAANGDAASQCIGHRKAMQKCIRVNVTVFSMARLLVQSRIVIAMGEVWSSPGNV